MYVTGYYTTVVMVIIYEDRLAASIYFGLQETLHPVGHFHRASSQCGGGIKVTQLYYVESKAEQLTRGDIFKGGVAFI